MSISVEVRGGEELERLTAHIAKLSDLGNRKKLLSMIGAEVETQTHRRLRSEKTAPDGTQWDAWSDSYAKSRNGNQSLLMAEGALDDSIQSFVRGQSVHIGSPLAYADVHQQGFDGMVNVPAHTRLIKQAFGKVLSFPVWQSVKAHQRHLVIPQREYLGLSDENEKELLTLIGDFYGDMLK